MRLAAAVAIIALAVAAPGWTQDEVAEPKSGVKFRLEQDDMALLGTGLRIKKILFVKAKVYAVGLYVSKEALEGPLAAHKGKTATPAFHKDLIWGDFPKQVVLKFTRNLGEKKIQDAMRDALKGTDKKLLDRFVSYFPEIKEGQECTLRWGKGGTLETTMVGQAKPPIESKDFAAALFALYLGPKPLQKDIKQGLVSRAGELLGS
jgi:hypothetical protein